MIVLCQHVNAVDLAGFGYSNSYKHSLQPGCAEKHLSINKTSKLKVNELQDQESTAGSSSVSQEQEV